MPRHRFGGTTGDFYWVQDSEGAVKTGPGGEARFYADKEKTIRYTNLAKLDGTVVSAVMTETGATAPWAAGQIAPIDGPDGEGESEITTMWCSVDGSPPFLMVAWDLGPMIAPLRATVDQHKAERNGHGTRVFDLIDVKTLTTDEVNALPDGWTVSWDATLKKFRIRTTPISIVTTDPTNPTEGEFWYNATDNQLRIRRGDTTESILTSGTGGGGSTGGGGGGGGGTATKPSDLLTLSKWELTLPTPQSSSEPNNPKDVYAPALLTYTDDNFKIDTDANGIPHVKFTANVRGTTTSVLSGATRSELREMGSENGGSSGPKAAWSFIDNNVHELTATMTVDPTGITNGRKELIIGQIHASGETPPIYLACDFNTLPGKIQLFKAGTPSFVIDDDVTTTTMFTYRLLKTGAGANSRMQIFYALGDKSALPATPQYDWPVSDFAGNSTGCYMKLGSYNKTKLEDADATGVGIVRVYAASLDNVGYITPGTKTGGGGGSGGGSGSAPIQVLAVDPPSPTEGQVWYNSTDHQLRVRRGDATESILTSGTGGGGGGGGGNPVTKPSELLTLSKWELTLPTPQSSSEPTNPKDVYAPELLTYTDDNFKIDTDAAGVPHVKFTANVRGTTTSTASGATRSELREMGSDNGGSSGPKAAWAFNDSKVHELIATMTVDPTGITNGRKELIIGQIHASGETPPIYLACDFNTLPGKIQCFKAGTPSFAILSNVTTTTRFTYKIKKTGDGASSRLQLSYALGNKADLPATPQYDWPISDFAGNDAGCYAKLGSYNKTKLDDTDATGVGIVRVYAASLDGVGYIVPGSLSGGTTGGSTGGTPAPTTGAWVDLTLGAGTVSRAGYPSAAVRKENSDTRAYLRGGVDVTAALANGAVLAVIPVGSRPIATHTVTIPGRYVAGTAIMTINPEGEVRVATALAVGQWVSFDNAHWPL